MKKSIGYTVKKFVLFGFQLGSPTKSNPSRGIYLASSFRSFKTPMRPSSTLESCDSWSVSNFSDKFLLVRKVKLASRNDGKQMPGWRMVKQLVAITIIKPSKIMNSGSSEVKREELNPPASSAIRYELRIKIVTVAVISPTKNALNNRELTISRYLGFHIPFAFQTRKKNSAQQMAKRPREKTVGASINLLGNFNAPKGYAYLGR